MRIAVFDFGSNSIKWLVAQSTPRGLKILADRRIPIRLSTAMDKDNCIPQAIINYVVRNLQLLKLIYLNQYKVKTSLAVGTEALRVAANKEDFINQIQSQTGIFIEVISPETEARLAWEGVVSGLDNPEQEFCLFDSGGASTEFVQGKGFTIAQSLSLPLGAGSLKKAFIFSDPPDSTELQALQHYLDGYIVPFTPQGRLLASGGGILACAKLILTKEPAQLAELDAYTIYRASLAKYLELLSPFTIAQLKQVPGMEADRAEIIIPALMLYISIMDKLGVEELSACVRGVRQGLLHRYLRRNHNTLNK